MYHERKLSAMPRSLLFALLIVFATPSLVAGRSICKKITGGQLRCDIRSVADCLAIEDYPYARNLYCPASYTAANQVFEVLLRNLGKQHRIQKQFSFYQTVPVSNPKKPGYLDPSQTQTPCMETPAPWNTNVILGAGQPLCHLIAYVSSVGSQGLSRVDPQNPIPPALRDYPAYFSALLDPSRQLPLTEFKSGGDFDPLVKGLGRDGYSLFVSDYPIYSSNTLYLPSPAALDPHFQGMSAGGGGGSGAEVVLNGNGISRTLLTFGGGGGGGLTSTRNPDPSNSVSALGAGGGGGMQFASDYRSHGRSYNQLGLGAGTSSNEGKVQYSYYQPISGAVTHNYDDLIISEYQQQLKNLFKQLRNGLTHHGTVVLKGGGGMGAGAEYLMADGEEYQPHALSTQAGFQFRFTISDHPESLSNLIAMGATSPSEPSMTAQQKKLYAALGGIYQFASQKAYEACGNNYDNYSCICPATQAVVNCLAGYVLKEKPSALPQWIQQAHCPITQEKKTAIEFFGNQLPLKTKGSSLSSYDALVLNNESCKQMTTAYARNLSP